MLRVHYPLFVAVMIAISCVSVTAPRPHLDTVTPIIHENIRSSLPEIESKAKVEAASTSFDGKLIEIEKKQEVILGQQKIITKRLDAIVDYVEGANDGNR